MSLGAADGGDDVSFAHRAGEMGVFGAAVGDSGIADQQQHPGRFSVTGGFPGQALVFRWVVIARLLSIADVREGVS
jgi:hypothetical protein